MPNESTRFPEIPAFATPFAGSPEASNRRARMSGHRRFVFGVDPAPSVIELPSATIAPVAAGFVTSTPDRNGQIRIVSAAKPRAAVRSPAPET